VKAINELVQLEKEKLANAGKRNVDATSDAHC